MKLIALSNGRKKIDVKQSFFIIVISIMTEDKAKHEILMGRE